MRPLPSNPAQSKERKGSNFAIWQPCGERAFDGHCGGGGGQNAEIARSEISRGNRARGKHYRRCHSFPSLNLQNCITSNRLPCSPQTFLSPAAIIRSSARAQGLPITTISISGAECGREQSVKLKALTKKKQTELQLRNFEERRRGVEKKIQSVLQCSSRRKVIVSLLVERSLAPSSPPSHQLTQSTQSPSISAAQRP